jgi:hypothetical protein
MKSFPFLWSAVLVLAVACSSGDDGTGPENTPANGSMSARIDGSSWTSTLAVSAGSSGGIIAISGTNGSTTIAMAFGIANGPATFQIGPAGAISNALLMESNGRSWHALSTVGNGTVTLTSISATGAAGTFAFTAPAVASSGATGSKVVTNGSFDVRF